MGQRLNRLSALPIRRKLLAMVLLPLWVVLPLLGLLLLIWGNAALDRLLVAKVRADLGVARGYFDRVLVEVGASSAAVAESAALMLALDRDDAPQTQALLDAMRQRERLDFIQWLGPDGQVQVSDSRIGGPALPWVPPAPGRPQASIERLEADALSALPPALQARVAVALLPTRNAAPSPRQIEDRALAVMATAAVRDAQGRLRGHVQAGVLLNRNLDFIDQLNDIVYPAGSLPWGSQGTATLFLDDVRISTNVRLFGGEREERAIGTRVSGAVREAVLGRGETWLDRAFVVQDWYVSGYLPLADHQSRRVGMLYVGFLEAPFSWFKYAALASIGLIFFAVMILSAQVSLRWARSIFRPLEQMSRTIQRLEEGEPSARVGPVASQDEIGALAAHFDHLLDTLDDKTQALERWNAELDHRVAERTAALNARSAELASAQHQLVRSEKLAAVGQLTASIAHEVNNPIAVIQGNLDLVRELLGAQAQPVRAELDLIDAQIERMRLIVTRLLQFARPTDYAGYVEPVDTAALLEDSLLLVGHLCQQGQIRIEREFHAQRLAGINRQELQQVLVNLLVNALQAMPAGGTLRLSTEDWDELGVCIRLADQGPGVSADLLDRLFQPFVTGKPEGTGLGLWISRSLVERYGGDLRVRNRAEGGAEFSVWLRTEPSLPVTAADRLLPSPLPGGQNEAG